MLAAWLAADRHLAEALRAEGRTLSIASVLAHPLSHFYFRQFLQGLPTSTAGAPQLTGLGTQPPRTPSLSASLGTGAAAPVIGTGAASVAGAAGTAGKAATAATAAVASSSASPAEAVAPTASQAAVYTRCVALWTALEPSASLVPILLQHVKLGSQPAPESAQELGAELSVALEGVDSGLGGSGQGGSSGDGAAAGAGAGGDHDVGGGVGAGDEMGDALAGRACAQSLVASGPLLPLERAPSDAPPARWPHSWSDPATMSAMGSCSLSCADPTASQLPTLADALKLWRNSLFQTDAALLMRRACEQVTATLAARPHALLHWR